MALLKGPARALAWLACAFGLCAQAQGVTEPAVKAAFLYKFAGYIDWPAAPATAASDAPFVIATLVADEVAAELAKILPGRSIAGRSAVVRTVREGEPLQGVRMLFVGRSLPHAAAIVRAAQQQGILAVTETSLEAGAAINFVLAENRVAFEVSLEAAERGGHRISSRMLAVARRVVPKGDS